MTAPAASAGGTAAERTASVRVRLPTHLRALAGIDGEVVVRVDAPITTRRLMDRLEAEHPALRGTIREHGSLARRDFVRFYACERDLSHDDVDASLPTAVASGEEPFLVVGAMAGG